MVNESTINKIAIISDTLPRVSELKRFLRILWGRWIVAGSMIIILVFIIIAIFAPIIAPFNPYKIDLASSLLQPDKVHLLGTDQLGRDTLSRIIYGTRTSLEIGLTVVITASVIGILLGLIAGYYRGWVYTVIMRFIDALMSFPMIILAVVIAALLGNGLRNVIIALSIPMIPSFARLICGQVLSVRENDYVTAAKSIGSSNIRIMSGDIIPNCLSPYIVLATMMLGSAILAEAGLSFLGVGITTPMAAWGSMVADGRPYLQTNPVLAISPGLALMVVVFAFNMVGDGLRDALDPRLRGLI